MCHVFHHTSAVPQQGVREYALSTQIAAHTHAYLIMSPLGCKYPRDKVCSAREVAWSCSGGLESFASVFLCPDRYISSDELGHAIRRYILTNLGRGPCHDLLKLSLTRYPGIRKTAHLKVRLGRISLLLQAELRR
jgi:hypothetical protein